MLTLKSSFFPCTDEVVAKVLDGEAIMINLSSGVYYSMGNAGAVMWELIAAGHTLGDVVTALMQHSAVSREQAESDVLGLAARLVEEKLVRLRDGEATPAGSISIGAESRLAYETPKLEIYRDIGHLVALDPPMPGLKDLPWKGPTDESSS